MAADIETLIRQALAKQNGFDPRVRQKIYQSSRNALAKMIARSGVVPPDAIEARTHALEDTISKIENEFAASINTGVEPPVDLSAIVEPQSAPEQAPQSAPISIPPAIEPAKPEVSPHAQEVSPQIPQSAPNQNPDLALAGSLADTAPIHHPIQPPGAQPSPTQAAPTSHAPVGMEDFLQENGAPLDQPGQYAEPTPHYARPRRKPIRYVIWLIVLAIIVIVGWIAFRLTEQYLTQTPANNGTRQVTSNTGETENGSFVTILDPSQPGALVTAGNGTAEILSDTSQPAVRIMSVRQPGSRTKQAKPLLLELAPGILKGIAGKKATVEIMAKSGDPGPATFAVVCDFGSLGECGRKRFRIGLQPEAVIFAIEISADYQEGQKAALAINTDVTSTAALSGKGAKIDIIHARIKTSEN